MNEFVVEFIMNTFNKLNPNYTFETFTNLNLRFYCNVTKMSAC